MSHDKETILKRYQQLSDEVLSTINSDELTDEGRAAYYEEMTRRSSSNYLEKKEAKRLELETANKIRTESKMSRWWVWTILTGLWILPTIGILLASLRGGIPEGTGFVMIPGAIIMLLRFLGPPPTIGRGLLLLIGCFMSIASMVWLIGGMPPSPIQPGWFIISIILVLFGFKWKKQ